MSIDNLIKEINFLAAKAKTEEGLTEEEKKLQKQLRQEYLAWFRENTKKQLDNITFEIVDGDNKGENNEQ